LHPRSTETFATATFALGKLRELSDSKNIGELELGEDSVIGPRMRLTSEPLLVNGLALSGETPIGHKNVGLFEIVKGEGHKWWSLRPIQPKVKRKIS
jgi:hypothetical protein